ncbi:helix-turn-helix transcriptional regulator [Streptomyces sp. 8P21H-1]|nr:helix-turn-helix domain-containing protein [Streptomyces sp. 8P21H-1]NSL43340.1 helix-turn-helix transcriptional regulator [Streptomyces sp. 8P21H-1]
MGTALRELRERTKPETVGVISTGPRRTQGLRREELADLAGMSADYLRRLEQGRRHPSPGVLKALSRALDVTAKEYEHLCRLAGYAATNGRVSRDLTPGAQRLLKQLDGTAACICDATWTLIGWNSAWQALTCDNPTTYPQADNLAWRVFVAGTSRVSRSAEHTAAFEGLLVADLRAASLRYPTDEQLASLITALRDASDAFDALWNSVPSAEYHENQMMLNHPRVGGIVLDFSVIDIRDGDLRALIFTASPESHNSAQLKKVYSSGKDSY